MAGDEAAPGQVAEGSHGREGQINVCKQNPPSHPQQGQAWTLGELSAGARSTDRNCLQQVALPGHGPANPRNGRSSHQQFMYQLSQNHRSSCRQVGDGVRSWSPTDNTKGEQRMQLRFPKCDFYVKR